MVQESIKRYVCVIFNRNKFPCIFNLTRMLYANDSVFYVYLFKMLCISGINMKIVIAVILSEKNI